MLRSGDRIDRYVVVGQLGEGALATVFLVRHATLNTLHGLKVVKLQSQEARDRLIKEGRAQASLDHEHIVNVTDVLTVQGAPGILMEYVRGIDLEQLLQQHFLTLEEALAIFRGVVCGVGEAHAKGLIHRDLKPANVLLAIEEGLVSPKVADFGLVKAAVGHQDMNGTRAGSTMGTPGYMPPEQIRDASTVDRRADMWALGCLLYRMVCHMPAFPQPDMIALFKAVDKGEFADPRSHTPTLPDAVITAIEGLIEIDQAARISDCQELLDVLDGAPRPEAKQQLATAQRASTSKDTHLPLTSPSGAQALAIRKELEASLAAHQPSFASLPGATLMPEETRRRLSWSLVALLLLGLVFGGLGIVMGVGVGVMGWTLFDDSQTTAPPEPVAAAPVTEPKRKAKVETRPRPEPKPAAPTPATPKPAPGPVAEPAPAQTVPAPTPSPEPKVAGPTGKVVCKDCGDLSLEVFTGDGIPTPQPNGKLSAGRYEIYAVDASGQRVPGSIKVELATDESVSRVRCNPIVGCNVL